jgi:hypothetical protein
MNKECNPPEVTYSADILYNACAGLRQIHAQFTVAVNWHDSVCPRVVDIHSLRRLQQQSPPIKTSHAPVGLVHLPLRVKVLH